MNSLFVGERVVSEFPGFGVPDNCVATVGRCCCREAAVCPCAVVGVEGSFAMGVTTTAAFFLATIATFRALPLVVLEVTLVIGAGAAA